MENIETQGPITLPQSFQFNMKDKKLQHRVYKLLHENPEGHLMISAWRATLKALNLTNNPQTLNARTACSLIDPFELIKRKQHTP